jgi:hypothetical protein
LVIPNPVCTFAVYVKSLHSNTLKNNRVLLFLYTCNLK